MHKETANNKSKELSVWALSILFSVIPNECALLVCKKINTKTFDSTTITSTRTSSIEMYIGLLPHVDWRLPPIRRWSVATPLSNFGRFCAGNFLNKSSFTLSRLLYYKLVFYFYWTNSNSLEKELIGIKLMQERWWCSCALFQVRFLIAFPWNVQLHFEMLIRNTYIDVTKRNTHKLLIKTPNYELESYVFLRKLIMTI